MSALRPLPLWPYKIGPISLTVCANYFMDMLQWADPGAAEQEPNLSLSDVVYDLPREQKLVRIVSVNTNMFSMSWLERDKEQNRFYLLPGMGGSAFRRKRRRILLWSVAAGLLVSAALAGLLYIMSAR